LAGTGKLPSFPWTVSDLPGMGAPVVGAGAVVTGTAVLVLDAVAELDELADGVPAEHAATAKVAAPAARASVAGRYLFIAFLCSVQNSQLTTLFSRPTGRARFAAPPGPHLREKMSVVTCVVGSPGTFGPESGALDSALTPPLYPCPLNSMTATVPPSTSELLEIA
jgi:hypothetical protein